MMAPEITSAVAAPDGVIDCTILMSFHIKQIVVRPWIMSYVDEQLLRIKWELNPDESQPRPVENKTDSDILLNWTSECFRLQGSKANNVDTVFFLTQAQVKNKRRYILNEPSVRISIVSDNVINNHFALATAVCHISKCRIKSKLCMLSLKLKSRQGSFLGCVDICYVSQQRWIKVPKSQLPFFIKKTGRSGRSSARSALSGKSSSRSLASSVDDPEEEIMLFWNSPNTCFLRAHEKDYQQQLMHRYITWPFVGDASSRSLQSMKHTGSIATSTYGSSRTSSIAESLMGAETLPVFSMAYMQRSLTAQASIVPGETDDEAEPSSRSDESSKFSSARTGRLYSIDEDDIEDILSQQNECIRSVFLEQFAVPSAANSGAEAPPTVTSNLYTKRTYSEDLLLNGSCKQMDDVDEESLDILECYKKAFLSTTASDVVSTRACSSGADSFGLTEQVSHVPSLSVEHMGSTSPVVPILPIDRILQNDHMQPPLLGQDGHGGNKMVVRRLAKGQVVGPVAGATQSIVSFDVPGQQQASQARSDVFNIIDGYGQTPHEDESRQSSIDGFKLPQIPSLVFNYYYQGFGSIESRLTSVSIDDTSLQTATTALNLTATERLGKIYDEMSVAALHMWNRDSMASIAATRREREEIQKFHTQRLYSSSWYKQFGDVDTDADGDGSTIVATPTARSDAKETVNLDGESNYFSLLYHILATELQSQSDALKCADDSAVQHNLDMYQTILDDAADLKFQLGGCPCVLSMSLFMKFLRTHADDGVECIAKLESVVQRYLDCMSLGQVVTPDHMHKFTCIALDVLVVHVQTEMDRIKGCLNSPSVSSGYGSPASTATDTSVFVDDVKDSMQANTRIDMQVIDVDDDEDDKDDDTCVQAYKHNLFSDVFDKMSRHANLLNTRNAWFDSRVRAKPFATSSRRGCLVDVDKVANNFYYIFCGRGKLY